MNPIEDANAGQEYLSIAKQIGSDHNNGVRRDNKSIAKNPSFAKDSRNNRLPYRDGRGHAAQEDKRVILRNDIVVAVIYIERECALASGRHTVFIDRGRATKNQVGLAVAFYAVHHNRDVVGRPVVI